MASTPAYIKKGQRKVNISNVDTNADRLPQGLVLDSATFSITGDPIQVTKDSSRVKIRVETPYGEDEEYVTIKEDYFDKPVLSAISNVYIYYGDSYTITPKSEHTALTSDYRINKVVWTATNLPAGLVIDSKTGVISGTAKEGSVTKTVKVTVTTNKGEASRSFTAYCIGVAPAPSISSYSNRSCSYNSFFSFQPSGTNITTNTMYDGRPGTIRSVTWTATGLPSGLSINSNTGLISGTYNRTVSQTYTSTVTVTTNGGSFSRNIVFSCTYTPPVEALQLNTSSITLYVRDTTKGRDLTIQDFSVYIKKGKCDYITCSATTATHLKKIHFDGLVLKATGTGTCNVTSLHNKKVTWSFRDANNYRWTDVTGYIQT